MNWKPLFTPNGKAEPWSVPPVVWIALGLILWQTFKATVFPNPFEVLKALPALWSDGLGSDILSSLTTNLEALVVATLIGLPICYLSRIPILTPVSVVLAKLRFAGSAVFYLPLLMAIDSPHSIKVGLLMLGNLFSLVTSMTGTIQNLPSGKYDDCATLKMSPWQAIWYVNIRGTVREAITAIKDCAGNGWAMLLFVEGVFRDEGGVGTVLLNSQKHDSYDEFFAGVLAVVLIGIAQDWLFEQGREAACPYA